VHWILRAMQSEDLLPADGYEDLQLFESA
jgi:hypothetical protein